MRLVLSGFCFTVLAAVLWAAQAVQDDSAASTPEEVVERYFQRIKADGIDTVADLMHPEDLLKLREMISPVIEMTLRDPADPTFVLFADENEPSQIRQLDDVAFMNLYMQWVSAIVPGINEIMKGVSTQVIGHVVEGDVKHVVVRSQARVEKLEMTKMQVVSMKDHDGQPRLLLSGEMLGIAAQLQQMGEDRGEH